MVVEKDAYFKNAKNGKEILDNVRENLGELYKGDLLKALLVERGSNKPIIVDIPRLLGRNNSSELDFDLLNKVHAVKSTKNTIFFKQLQFNVNEKIYAVLYNEEYLNIADGEGTIMILSYLLANEGIDLEEEIKQARENGNLVNEGVVTEKLTLAYVQRLFGTCFVFAVSENNTDYVSMTQEEAEKIQSVMKDVMVYLLGSRDYVRNSKAFELVGVEENYED